MEIPKSCSRCWQYNCIEATDKGFKCNKCLWTWNPERMSSLGLPLKKLVATARGTKFKGER